jgi:simple sugar transport system ATP-binding protein
MTITENLIATQIDDKVFCDHLIMKPSACVIRAKELAETYDIRPRDTEVSTGQLSGGNAQKVVVAREVSTSRKLLVASQPTRGVDIGAIEAIRSILESQKRKGVGILLVSADLEEILSLSDRIIVMHEGRITGSMKADEANEDNLGLLMMGSSGENAKRGKGND